MAKPKDDGHSAYKRTSTRPVGLEHLVTPIDPPHEPEPGRTGTGTRRREKREDEEEAP